MAPPSTPERDQPVLSLAARQPTFVFGAIMAGATLISVVALLLVFALVSPLRDELALLRESAPAQGTVVRKDARPSGRARYVVTYEFLAADGRLMRDEAQVEWDAYERLAEGGAVSVEYLPSDPSVSRLVDGGVRWILLLPTILLPILLVNLGIAAFALRHAWATAALRRRLLREGVEVTGRVTRVTPTLMRVNRRRQHRVHYAYEDDLGASHAGASAMMDEAVAAGWKPGDEGPVRYDPRAPSRSIWVGRDVPADP
jgi:hypothetical protein